MYDDLITEARELCEYSEKIVNQLHTERLDYELEYMPLIETIQVTSGLCDALEKAEAEARALSDRNQELKEQNRRLLWRKWIPVTERLPEPETNVLICQHYHEDAPYAKITIGHLHQDRDLRHKPYWNWIAYGADMVHPKIEAYHRAAFICPGKEFVTHWRPLPEPPKGV